jgi:hypothetical protein
MHGTLRWFRALHFAGNPENLGAATAAKAELARRVALSDAVC